MIQLSGYGGPNSKRRVDDAKLPDYFIELVSDLQLLKRCCGYSGFESVQICCFLKLAVKFSLFVETRVPSSGETWQAKLIEVITIAAQRYSVVLKAVSSACSN